MDIPLEGFLCGGLSSCLSFLSFCFRFGGLDQRLLAARWSRHLPEDYNPSYIFMHVV